MNSIMKIFFFLWICFSTLLLANDVFKGVLKEEIQKAAPGERFRVIILMEDQVDVAVLDASLTQNRATLQYRHQLIVESLRQKSDETQGEIIARIRPFQESGKVSFFRSFWIINAINLEADAEVIMELSERQDIAAIYKDGFLSLDKPVRSVPAPESNNSAEPGLKAINAHLLWKMGITGEGVIVMNIDTGVDGTHPALASRWRGNDPGVSASEAWFDPIIGASSPEDSDDHGTHTMGTMTGLDASNNDTIGVAFNAKWIAARTIDVDNPHTSYSLAAFQWAADPDGDPGTVDDVPAVINCSWRDSNVSACAQTYWQAIDNVEAIGTAVVFLAGNSGPGQQTIWVPANRITTPVNIWATGAIDGNNPSYPIANFSSRGPSICDGQTKKPEVVAPGVQVRSSVPGGCDEKDGTSMAAPHVSGAVALLRSAFPWMTGTELKTALLNTARDLGTIVGEDNTYGMGIIDVYAAYNYLKRTVVLDQVRESGARMTGSYIGHWVETEFNDIEITTPPETLTFYGPTQEVFRAKQDLITGPTEKFNRWNEDPDVRNHREFDIEPGESELTSRFKTIFEVASIQTNFLHGGSGGLIAFKDPWYVDSTDPQYFDPPYGYRNLGLNAVFEEHPSGFSITIASEYKGVFLDQEPDPGNPNVPYYSVQAPTQPMTVNGKSITYDLESWSANGADITYPTGNPTSVIFHQNNATVTANLKGRRTSDTPQATANNNGGKITYHYASVTIRKPYLVYEDRGSIYSASQNSSGEWQKDGRISAATANILNQTPAVAYLHEISGIPADQRAVAWTEYRVSQDNYTLQSSLASFPEPNWLMPDPPHPAVSGYRLYSPAVNTAVVAFHGSGGLPLEVADHGIWLWFTRDGVLYQVSGEASADYPTLDNRKSQPSVSWKEPWYFLAWQENSGIQYRRFYRKNDSGSQVTVDQDALLNYGYSGLTAHERPSLRTVMVGESDAYNVYVVWQAMDSGLEEKVVSSPGGESENCTLPSVDKRVVCFRENSGGWQSLNIFVIDNTCNRNPVVTAWDAGSRMDCAIAYEKGGGEMHYIYRGEGEEWSQPQTLTDDGNHPSLTRLNGAVQGIWTEYNNSPYRVQHSQVSLIPDESIAGPEQTGPPHSRRIYFKLRESLVGGQQLPINGEITFEIGDPQWIIAGGVQPVRPLYRDSLITPENAFRFNPITISRAGERLIVPVKIVGRDLKRVSPTNNPFPLPLLRLRLKDGNTGQVLQTVHTFQSTVLGNDSTKYIAVADTFEIELSALISRRIQVEGATFFNPIDPGKGRPQIAEVYDLREETPLARLTGKVPAAAANAEIPGQFSLSQNYPNPFNPTTTIEFQLPQNSHASLKIYDIQSRLVKTLLKQEMEAGSHQITWDGRDDAGNAAASGVYLYHFVAGNFQQTYKMVLIR